jgi:hypothetical protein
MITIAAIDRPAGTRLEGDLSLFAAFGTGYRIHMPDSSLSVDRRNFSILITLGWPASGTSGPARRTTLGRMSVSLGVKSLLVIGRKRVGSATVKAF